MKMFFKDFSRAQIFKIIIGAILALVILLLVFQMGRFVGFRQAVFSGRLGDNYFWAMEGPNRGPMGFKGPRGFMTDDLPNGHGAVGQVIKINLPTIVVAGPDGLEKVVKINNDTIIRRFRDTIKNSELVVGDSIVVIGSADEASQIEAKLIRLLPPPPVGPTTTPKR